MWQAYWFLLGFLFSVIHDSNSQIEPGHHELGCPMGSYKHGNYCYKIGDNVEVTYPQALNYCKNDGGTLAIIRDKDTQEFLHRLRMRKLLHCYWIGLTDFNGEGKWIFEDGTKLTDYTNWDVGEPNNNGGVQDCTSLLMHKDLKWDDEYCYMKFLYICEFPVSKCAKNATIYKEKCYEPSHDFAIYEDARDNCTNRGGQLAMIKTEEIDKLIRSVIYNDTFWLTMTEDDVKAVYAGLALKFTWIAGSWIGLQFKENKWTFIDGTTVNYTHWFNDDQIPSFKQCAILGKTMNPYSCGIFYSYGKSDYTLAEIDNCYQYAHKWNNENCDAKHSYICQYSVSTQATSSPAVSNEHEPTTERHTTSNKINLSTDQDAKDSEPELETTNGTSSTNNLQKPQQYTDDGNKESQNNGLHIGVAPFVVMVISCIGIGMLLSVVIFGVIQLRRTGTIITYDNM